MFEKKNIFVVCLILISFIITPSCKEASITEEDCHGYGKLRLTNKSKNTVHRLQVDGINYGTISPNESKNISLPAGYHTVETINANTGNYACTPFNVIIIECETEGFSCSG